jgi:hypothetical protein
MPSTQDINKELQDFQTDMEAFLDGLRRVRSPQDFYAFLDNNADHQDFLSQLGWVRNKAFPKSYEVLRAKIPRLMDRSDLNDLESELADPSSALKILYRVATDPTLDDEEYQRHLESELPRHIQTILKYLPAYFQALTETLTRILTPSPSRFHYKGLRIENEGGYTDLEVRHLLDNLDWMFSVFERRGVKEILTQSLTTVVLSKERWAFVGERSKENLIAAATYHGFKKKIVLREGAMTFTGPGNFLQRWLAEVFVHELGHHVHLNYITKEAREFWDSGWQFVNEAEERFVKETFVTEEDKRGFWEKIKASNYDFQKAARKMESHEKLKYLYFLSGMRWSTVSTQVRLSKRFKSTQNLLKDPEKRWVIEALESGKDLDTVWEERIRKGLSTPMSNGDTPYYAFSMKQVRDHFFSNIRLPIDKSEILADLEKARDAEVEEALNALQVPTSYSKENVKEDFAETFVGFVMNPSSLSDIAKWRMGRTLGMSESGGKPVMKLTKRMAFLVNRVASRAYAKSYFGS